MFEAVAEQAMRLLGAWSAVVTRYNGELLHFGAAAVCDSRQEGVRSQQASAAARSENAIWPLHRDEGAGQRCRSSD